jgi:hypothetical protein
VNLTVLTAVMALIFLGSVVELVRRRRLREKYAALWILVGLVVVPLGFFPTALNAISRQLGVASAVSLVLFAGIMFLLLVCLHLSWESSRLEDETRVLAEEVALLRLEVAELTAREVPNQSRPEERVKAARGDD